MRPVASTCPPQLSKCLGSEATRRVAGYLSRNINNTPKKSKKGLTQYIKARSGCEGRASTLLQTRVLKHDRFRIGYTMITMTMIYFSHLQPGFPLLVSGRCHQKLLQIHTVQILETNLYLTSCKLAVICSDHIDGEVENLKRSRNMWNFGKTLGKLWENFGKTLGKLWENFGKTLGKLWENFGKTLGKLWENFGKRDGKGWKGDRILMALVCQDAKLWASPFLSHGGHPPTSRHSEPQKGNIRNIIVTYGKIREGSSAFWTTPNRAQSVLKWFSKVYNDLQYVLNSKYL